MVRRPIPFLWSITGLAIRAVVSTGVWVAGIGNLIAGDRSLGIVVTGLAIILTITFATLVWTRIRINRERKSASRPPADAGG